MGFEIDWPGLRVIIVNGQPSSGKTLFEQYCQDYLGHHRCLIRSSIDCIKNLASICGWNGVKDERSRKFLSDLKKLTTEYNEYPRKDIEDYLLSWEESLIGDFDHDILRVLFVDIREPHEIEKFVKYFNAQTVLVMRADAETITSNDSDRDIFNYTYDYIIANDGPKEALRQSAREFIDTLARDIEIRKRLDNERVY